MTALLELRILSGTHAGARVPLDGNEYIIGSDDDCDVVLAEEGIAPQYARLYERDGEWLLEPLAEQPVAAAVPWHVATGKAIALGPLILCIDEPAAAWPTLEQLVLTPPVHALHIADLDTAESGESPEVVGSATGRKRWMTGVSTALMASASAVALVAWPMNAHHPEPAKPAARVSAAAASSAVATSAASAAAEPARAAVVPADIASLIAAQGLQSPAKVEPVTDGWMVTVAFATESQAEALRAGLARMQPRPRLRLISEEDMSDRIADQVSQLAADMQAKVAPKYIGNCRYRIEGRVAQPDDREKIRKELAKSFPQVCDWDFAVTAGDEDAGKLLAELRSGGDWDVDGAVQEGRLRLQVKLQQRDVPQWERALLASTARHPTPFDAQLEFLKERERPAASTGQLPFDIVGVMGGAMPYVLLPGGRTLATGAIWDGWRLASISAREVIFESGSRRAVLAR